MMTSEVGSLYSHPELFGVYLGPPPRHDVELVRLPVLTTKGLHSLVMANGLWALAVVDAAAAIAKDDGICFVFHNIDYDWCCFLQ